MPQYRKSKKPGKRKTKRSFNETRVGYLLEHKTPLEYRLILDASGVLPPSPELIEAVSYASLDPFFRTTQFHVALMNYRETGLFCKPVKPQVERELRYIRYRRQRAKEAKRF